VCEAVEEENRSNEKGRRETKRMRRIGATKKGGKRKRRTREKKKEEERDEKGKQHEKQLEGVSLLECNLCKSTLVVEVCRHRLELLIVVKVWSFHRDFLIF
jgi:hypothetical protein